MIKFHPTFELLQRFVDGDLPASLSAGVAIHASMCSACHKHITVLTEQVAEISFELNNETMTGEDINFDDMISNITASDDITPIASATVSTVSFKGQEFNLPPVLNKMNISKTLQVGKLARARINLDEGEIHTSLLHIEPGGSVPEHTHNGFELTVLLDGSFSDEQDQYVKGDFIMLDKRHQHHPVSESGCLCFTVANDSLHFTQGLNRLFNPIGSFIY